MSKRVWVPLADGRYDLDTQEPSYLVVENYGEYGYQRTEQVFPGWDEVSTFSWTGDVRLCRLTDADDGAVRVPDEIVQTIRAALDEVGEDIGMNPSFYADATDATRKVNAALAWLATQGNGAEGGGGDE